MSSPPTSPRTSNLPRTPRTPQTPSSRQGHASFPFPQHESPRRQSATRGGSLRARRTSTTSSILSLATSNAATDSIAEAGSNAISALLQPPIIRTGLLPHTHAPSGIRPPSTRDIPPVTLTQIPHVEASSFQPYIAQAGSLYNALRQAREETESRRHSGTRRDSDADGSTPANTQFHGMQRRPSLVPPTPVSATPGTPSTPSAETPSLRRKGSADGRRRPGLAVAPLSTIPSVYFEEDFRLDNPRTFDVVSEKSEIVTHPDSGRERDKEAADNPAGGRKALAANAILQEKLSWYMDTVEIHLISSISTASTSFFDALKSLRELHAEAEESVKQITVLREDLSKLDENMAKGGLEIVALKRKRDNLQQLGDAVRQLESVMDGFAKIEKQVDGGEIEDALDNVSRLQKLISGQGDLEMGKQVEAKHVSHQGPLVDLRKLKALESASDDIAYLKKRVGTVLEAKFIATLLGDLRQHVDRVPANDTFRRWDTASSRRRGQHARTPSGLSTPAYMEIDPQFKDQLRAQLKSLAKSDCIMQATSTYREAVQKEFKNLIRRHIPTSSDEDAESTTSIATAASRSRTPQDRSAVLARNLRALDDDDAEKMFKGIYSNVGEALRRLGTQVKVLLDVTSHLSAPPPGARSPGPRSPMMSPRNSSMDVRLRDEAPLGSPAFIPQDEIQQVLDLSSLLGQAVDISQNQITKLLKVRTDQTTQLGIPFFLRYFTLNRLFADECEAVSGRSGVALKTVVQEHIKTFVQIAGDAEKQGLVRKMDADTWDARDFGSDESEKLKLITDASTKEIESWSRATIIWSDVIKEASNHSMANGNGTGLGLDMPSINEPPASLASAQIANSTNGAITPSSQPTTPLSEPAKGGKPTVRSAELDEQLFLLPSSALAALSGIITYLQLVTCIPALAPDIAISLLDFLRLFNSRSQQLILGAGATRSAGLKNITTKHLALSSQALSFIAALVPYVRESVRRYLPTAGAGSGVLADFDKVKRTLQEHQAGIVDKLVEIMNGRATAHVVSFKKVDWERNDAGTVGSYMETLAKETTMLQKVLSRHLPETTVFGIMSQVMAGYKDVWIKAFTSVELRSQEAKKRLHRDADFFKARIGRLEAAGDIGDAIIKIVESKKVTGDKTPAPTVPATDKKEPEKETTPVEDVKLAGAQVGSNGDSEKDTQPKDAEKEKNVEAS